MDTTTAPNTPNTQDAPATDAPKVPKQSPRVEHSDAIAAYAKLKGIDNVRAGKLFRSRLRANFDIIAKKDPKHYGAKGTIKKVSNNNAPWGSHSRAVLRDLGLSK